ncbi:hypothetical protein [Litorimonas sp.]|uniref:hypothetical protein n=1 Tax=Litorimonas sp. TaxID=1892381 RepID=UPI003A8ABD90
MFVAEKGKQHKLAVPGTSHFSDFPLGALSLTPDKPQCRGEPGTVRGVTINFMMMVKIRKITIKKMTFTEPIPHHLEAEGDHLRLVGCNIHDGKCVTSSGTYQWTPPETDRCTLARIRDVFMKKEENNTYVGIEGSKLVLQQKSPKIAALKCASNKIYQTQHEGVYMAKGHFKKDEWENLDHRDLRISLQIDAAISSTSHHLEEEIEKAINLAKTSPLCRAIENSGNSLIDMPGTKGTKIQIAGDLIRVIQCTPTVRIAQPHHRCFDKVPLVKKQEVTNSNICLCHHMSSVRMQ